MLQQTWVELYSISAEPPGIKKPIEVEALLILLLIHHRRLIYLKSDSIILGS